MSKRNKIARCELFFKELVFQKRNMMNEQAIESNSSPLGQGVWRSYQYYIYGLEFAIDGLGKILDMNEDDFE